MIGFHYFDVARDCWVETISNSPAGVAIAAGQKGADPHRSAAPGAVAAHPASPGVESDGAFLSVVPPLPPFTRPVFDRPRLSAAYVALQLRAIGHDRLFTCENFYTSPIEAREDCL